MKIKCILIALSVVATNCIIAENVPLEIKEKLYGLTNYWGKGTSQEEYNKVRQSCYDQLEGYDDRRVVEEKWTESFLQYLVNNSPFEGVWMSASADEMLLASVAGSTRRSTNCWFIVADYAKKLTAMEKTARQKFNQLLEAESFDTPETNRTLRLAAWSNLVEVECALGQSMRVTTNSYPRWILPTLSPEEGAELYTNVLRRAGLVQ